MTRNLPESLRARLLALSKAKGEEFQLVLTRYACERFLYRLGSSPARERCILKGASLLALWMDDPYRSTRDLDLLASGPSDVESVRTMIETICSQTCTEDGLTFDLENIEVTPIREEAEYHGQRATLNAYLARARIALQIDIGYGDVVHPAPEEVSYPGLIEALPAPKLRAYPRETVVAEKFECLLRLGSLTSRMKDFHDIWALSSLFAFDGTTLATAVSLCAERRKTTLTQGIPEGLTAAMYEKPNMTERWRSYIRKGAFVAPPPGDFGAVGERMIAFLGPVRESIVAGAPFETTWPAGGPWRQA
jgi:hypothetical protein